MSNNLWFVVGLIFLLSLSLPVIVKPFLERLGCVDAPTHRSSHAFPTIRGGGLAPLIAMAVGVISLTTNAGFDPSEALLIGLVGGTSVMIGTLGLIEDLAGLSIAIRVVLQFGLGLVACGIAAWLLGVPLWIAPLGGLVVAASTNVANFMDGINGMSSFHGLVIGASYYGIGIIYEHPWLAATGLLLAACFAAFYPWNAKGTMFLGDVGSYLLGAAVGFAGVLAWLSGVPLLAAISPSVIYLIDTGLTLFKRAVSGQRWYEPHRSHLYQRLTDSGVSHLAVSAIVASASSVSALLGIYGSVQGRIGMIIAATAICAVVMAYLWVVRLCEVTAERHGAKLEGNS